MDRRARGCLVSLRTLALMTDEQRAERREFDEAAYHRVRAIIAAGTPRPKSWAKAAGQMQTERDQVIAGYWRHVKRTGAAK